MADQFERMIFILKDGESLQEFLDYKSNFGWRYVRQIPRSRTVSARHSGGGYSVGSGIFVTSSSVRYTTTFWTEVELARPRDRHHATLAACEEAIERDWPYPAAPPTFQSLAIAIWICLNAVTVAWCTLASITSALFFPDLNRWVEKTTAGVALTPYVFALMASFVAPALLWPTIRLQAIRRGLAEYEAECAAITAERERTRKWAWDTIDQIARDKAS